MTGADLLGLPPEFLSAEERAAWLDLKARSRARLLPCDRFAVETAAALLAAVRAGGREDLRAELLAYLKVLEVDLNAAPRPGPWGGCGSPGAV